MNDAQSANEFAAPPPHFLPPAEAGQFYFWRTAMNDTEDFLIGHALDDSDGEQQPEQHRQPWFFALVPWQPAEQKALQIRSRREEDYRAPEPLFQVLLHFLGQRLPAAVPQEKSKRGDGEESGQHAESRTEDRLEEQAAKDDGKEWHA